MNDLLTGDREGRPYIICGHFLIFQMDNRGLKIFSPYVHQPSGPRSQDPGQKKLVCLKM
jgi:hypothetical protein